MRVAVCRRPGVTLVEVLVSISVMAIGMLALMSLFPLGVLNMAQAVKNDRAAQVAANALAIGRMWDIANYPKNVPSDFNTPPVIGTMLNYYTFWRSNGPDTITSGPSVPIFIDPIGYQATQNNQSPSSQGVGNMVSPAEGAGTYPGNNVLIPRVSPPSLQNPNVFHWCMLDDDITFGPDGQVPPTGLVREGRYSWAWLCRIPEVSKPDLIDTTVVVYSGRGLSLTAANGGFVIAGEQFFTPTFYPQGNALYPNGNIISVGGTNLGLRRGSWLLDASDGALPAWTHERHHAYFYRVVNATESGGSTLVEVTPPLRGFTGNTGVAGRMVKMDNVVEVFEKRGNPQ